MKDKLSLPKSWEILTLGDVCERGSSNVSQNQLDNEVGDYPIFGASGLIKNVSFYHQEKPYLSIVKDGSGVGRVTKMNGYTSVIGTLQYVMPKENVDLNYLYYNFISIDFKKYVAGAAIPHIYFKDYKNEPFLWMPLPEQKRIVAILDEAFATIAKAKFTAEQNLKNAKKLFDSYLQQVFSHKGEGWISTKIGNILALEYGKPLDKSMRKNNGRYPVYGANGIKTRSDQFYCENKTIIVGRKGSAGELNLTEEKFWPLDVTYFVKFDDKKLDLIFIYHLLYRLNLPSLAKGVKPGINRNVVYEIKVNVPCLDTQKQISNKLNQLSKQISILEDLYRKKLEKLYHLKKIILQKAFSGEITESKSAL